MTRKICLPLTILLAIGLLYLPDGIIRQVWAVSAGSGHGAASPLPLPASRPATIPQPMAATWIWQPIAPLSQSFSDSSEATVAITHDGTTYVVWTEAAEEDWPRLYYCTSNEAGWSEPCAFFIGQDPDLTVSPDGVVHLVYSSELFGNQEIYHTTWANGDWGIPENISNTEGSSTQPAITVANGGQPLVVWTEGVKKNSRIYYAWQEDHRWSTYLIPATGGGSAPDVALGEANRVWVVWQALENSHHDIYALFGACVEGITWAPYAMNISDTPANDSLAPALAGAPGVGAFLTWQEREQETTRIYYADNLEYGAFWGEPICLSPSGLASERPSIAARGPGSVHVAWDAGNQLLLRYRLPDESWSPQTVIANDPTAIGEVALALSPDLTLHAVWSQQVTAPARNLYHRSGKLDWPYHAWLALALSP